MLAGTTTASPLAGHRLFPRGLDHPAAINGDEYLSRISSRVVTCFQSQRLPGLKHVHDEVRCGHQRRMQIMRTANFLGRGAHHLSRKKLSLAPQPILLSDATREVCRNHTSDTWCRTVAAFQRSPSPAPRCARSPGDINHVAGENTDPVEEFLSALFVNCLLKSAAVTPGLRPSAICAPGCA